MIQGTVVGADTLVARLESVQPKILQSLEKTMNRVMAKLQAKVVTDKLSGQVLRVQTGTLRRSITNEVTASSTGVTGMVGTNLEYAAYHEYGFSGTVNVREHLRRAKVKAVYFTQGSRAGEINLAATKRKMKAQEPTIKVRAHTRKVEYPEHSFLRSAMRDMQDEIMQEIRQAVAEGVRN